MNKQKPLSLEELEARTLLSADFIPLFEADFSSSYSVDGSGNNPDQPDWGSTEIQLLRLTTPEYADGIDDPAGDTRPSAREISNTIASQTGLVINDAHLTDFIWLWGQFVDHDIDLTGSADPVEGYPVEIPYDDSTFDPGGLMDLSRSHYDKTTGLSTDNPRQQINSITAWLDGSVIYGSDPVRATELRALDGTGRLKTSDGDLLPFNTAGLDNAGGPSESLFLAGDVRANENAALTAMQTLWVREHNYWADQIAADDSSLTGDQIYERARAIVTAEMQAITYNEFLPALLGEGAVAPYSGYDPSVNPGISNIFSTAAYRVGHTMLSPTLQRLNNDGTVIDDGNLALRDAFFAPQELIDNGIDSLLLGAANQNAQEIDNLIIDDVRNFLFTNTGTQGFDLASLNIQRGRDHGLADYNQARVDFGLAPAKTWADISSNPDIQAKLEALYGDVDNIDVWVGALAEDHVPGSNVGELIQTVLVDQFSRIRDGDPGWYQNVYSGKVLKTLDQTTLADVILRNTDITSIQDNVFYDSSVLTYKADGRHENLTVVVGQESVDVVDNRTGEVRESRPLTEVSQVILTGSDRGPNHITVDMRNAAQTIPDGILINGSAGRGDTLTIRSTSEQDLFLVDGSSITLNGQTIQISGVDLVNLQMNKRQDQVQVLSPLDARLQITSVRMGHDHHHHDHQNHLDGAKKLMTMLLASGPSLGAVSPATRRMFDQMREDLLHQLRDVLTDNQLRVFAQGLGANGAQGHEASNVGSQHGPQTGNGRQNGPR